MTSGNRLTWGLVVDILDVLERHGYRRHDEQHTGRAVLMIGDLASTYTGRDTHPGQEPEPPSEAERDAVTLTGTIMAALDMAASTSRDLARACAGCTDRSCPACRSRLRDAEAYDQIAAQIHGTDREAGQ
jgi:hypothetical protein